jgi:hypothetical protein
MKWFLIFWAGPIAFLGAWYGLSYYDVNFGVFILSRQAHDLIFNVYGKILGMPPEAVPPLIARALATDSLFVFALLAFRKRAIIKAWWRQWRQRSRASQDQAKPVESALKDEGRSGGIDALSPLFPRNIHFQKRPFGSNG